MKIILTLLSIFLCALSHAQLKVTNEARNKSADGVEYARIYNDKVGKDFANYLYLDKYYDENGTEAIYYIFTYQQTWGSQWNNILFWTIQDLTDFFDLAINTVKTGAGATVSLNGDSQSIKLEKAKIGKEICITGQNTTGYYVSCFIPLNMLKEIRNSIK